MKSTAPYFMAETASSMVPKAVMTMTSESGDNLRTCCSTWRPSILAILRSVITRSAPSSCRSSIPLAPSSAADVR